MPRVSISVGDDLLEEINEQLEYGDSRSAWFEEAARHRLQLEDSDDDCFPTPPPDG